MSQWMVNRGDSQFTVGGLAELKQLAADGDLHPGDLIQPQGADDWIYAIEVSDLSGLLKKPDDDDDDDFDMGRSTFPMRTVMAAIMGLVALVNGGAMAYFVMQLPTEQPPLHGQPGATMSYSQMLTTIDADLRDGPENAARAITLVPKDSPLELLAKRGDYYKVRTQSNQEGWVRVDQVIAMYMLGDQDVREEYDPLYNPDQYVHVANASWLMVDEEGNNITTFSFMLGNDSMYDMTDLVLQAVIKDSKGSEVGVREFAIEGVVPAEGTSFVGTLQPTDEELDAAEEADEEPPPGRLMTAYSFDQDIVSEDEEANLLWLDGVELELEGDFVNATIRVAELRALPKGSSKD